MIVIVLGNLLKMLLSANQSQRQTINNRITGINLYLVYIDTCIEYEYYICEGTETKFAGGARWPSGRGSDRHVFILSWRFEYHKQPHVYGRGSV